MGLFGKMFEKKNCDICGGEIGLLGNKSLKTATFARNARRSFRRGFLIAAALRSIRFASSSTGARPTNSALRSLTPRARSATT